MSTIPDIVYMVQIIEKPADVGPDYSFKKDGAKYINIDHALTAKADIEKIPGVKARILYTSCTWYEWEAVT